MKTELDEQICKEFPLLYKQRGRSAQETCMYWGIAVGDGWFKLIYDLSSKLEPLIKAYEGDEDCRPCASQVKEKFGGLRFYMDGNTTKEMDDLISAAESEASETCETCGSKDNVKHWGGGWIKYICEACNEKKIKDATMGRVLD